MEHLLEIKNLTILFDTNDGSLLAVIGFDFNLPGG